MSRFTITVVATALIAPTSGTPLAGQAAPATWSLSPEPLLRIGATTGAEEYLFQTITGIVRLPGDRLAVADDGFLTIRVYDRSGQYLYQMGRHGDGPGEFQSIDGLWLTDAGELAVWDSDLRRITRFTQAGILVESKPIVGDREIGNLQPAFGPMADGQVLLGALTTGPTRTGESPTHPYLLRRYNLSGEFRGSVGQAEGMWRYEWGDGSNTPLPFTPLPWVATWHDTVYVAAGYDPEIEVRDRSGAVLRTLTVPGARAATRKDWAEMERVLRARANDLSAGAFYVGRLERRDMPFDDRMPGVAGLLLDDAGLVWVKAFEPARDARWLRRRTRPPAPGGKWVVLDPTSGVVVATVEMPSSLVPLVIGDTEIIGMDEDSLGVERVVIHKLRRGKTP